MQVLVIGGTRFIGRHLVTALLKGGHQVSVLHRRAEHDLGKKVANLQADRNDPSQVKAALHGRTFEAVFDLVYDVDRGTPAAAVEASAKLLAGSLRRYVFLSSVNAYGDGLNHHEGDALAVDDHADRFVREKSQSERVLFRLHQRYGIPAVTLRAPHVFGPLNPLYREQFFWDRLRDKRAIVLPGDGRRLMQFVSVADLVWAMLRVLETPNCVGHAFNVASPRALTQAEYIEALAQACGKPAEVVRVPRERILRSGGHPYGPRLYFGDGLDVPAVTAVVSKAQRVLRFKPAPVAEGLKETYKWYQRHGQRRAPDYGFEDLLLCNERTQLAS